MKLGLKPEIYAHYYCWLVPRLWIPSKSKYYQNLLHLKKFRFNQQQEGTFVFNLTISNVNQINSLTGCVCISSLMCLDECRGIVSISRHLSNIKVSVKLCSDKPGEVYIMFRIFTLIFWLKQCIF